MMIFLPNGQRLSDVIRTEARNTDNVFLLCAKGSVTATGVLHHISTHICEKDSGILQKNVKNIQEGKQVELMVCL